MKNILRVICILFSSTLFVACSWVDPTVAGKAVRVAYDGRVAGCRDAGIVAVSVADKIAFYHRSEYKIADELETMARNEAATLPADTIVPRTSPVDGTQRFQAYVCASMQIHRRGDAATPNAGSNDAQTYPVQQH